MNKVLILFFFFTLNLKAQLNNQFLYDNWTKVKTRMLDGSKDVTEPYITSKFYQWIISNKKLCMNNDAIYISNDNCMNYSLEKNFIRTSKLSGYEIEKLTSDSLIVIERIDGINELDKVKKMSFIKTSKITNGFIEKTKNDSILVATENFTPKLTTKFIAEINKAFNKKNIYPNFNLIGNIIIYPKKQKIELEVINKNEIESFKKPYEIEKSIIENTFNNWNLNNFKNFEKILIPFIIQSKSYSFDGFYYKGSPIFFFINNTQDIEKIYGIKMDDLKNSNNNFNNAISAFEEKKYDKAIILFRKSYQLDNRKIDALYNIASIFSLKNDTENLCSTLKILKDLEQVEGTKLYDQKCNQ